MPQRRMRGAIWPLLAALILLALAAGPAARAAPGQVLAGEQVYQRSCLACHGPGGQGGSAPRLAGPAYAVAFPDAAEAMAFISQLMPKGAPGSLSEAEYWQVVAYLFAINGFDAGEVELGPASAPLFTFPWFGADVRVEVDGRPLDFDVPPGLEQGRLLVPLRAIFSALGARVEWEAASRSVTATRGGRRVEVTIDSPLARVDGSAVHLDVPPRIRRDRTLVPVRFVSTALGAQVQWLPRERLVRIGTGP